MSRNKHDPAMQLTVELRDKLVRRLAREWDELNWALFRNRMRRPLIEVVDDRSVLGRWRAGQRTIALSLPGILRGAWLETIETLKHEMAHQYVDEVLGGEERPHGPRFRQVCIERGINPRAAGDVTASDGEGTREDRIIARVEKLLALAESSNQHEAELAAATAQKLMLKFNLDRASTEATGESTREGYEYRWLGEPTGRVQAHQRALAGLLTEHFFVEGIWVPVYRPHDGKRGTVLELCGRRENLEMAEFVHAFVSRTIERLWEEHKREQGITSNRDRRSFLAGAVAGFDAKLDERKAVSQREGLVWVQDAAAQELLRRRYPRTVRQSYGMAGSHDAYADGHSAGGTIVLSKPVEGGRSGRPPRAIGAGVNE